MKKKCASGIDTEKLDKVEWHRRNLSLYNFIFKLKFFKKDIFPDAWSMLTVSERTGYALWETVGIELLDCRERFDIEDCMNDTIHIIRTVFDIATRDGKIFNLLQSLEEKRMYAEFEMVLSLLEDDERKAYEEKLKESGISSRSSTQ